MLSYCFNIMFGNENDIRRSYKALASILRAISITCNMHNYSKRQYVEIKFLNRFLQMFDDSFWQLLDDYVSDRLCDGDFMTRKSLVGANIRLALEQVISWRSARPSVGMPPSPSHKTRQSKQT